MLIWLFFLLFCYVEILTKIYSHLSVIITIIRHDRIIIARYRIVLELIKVILQVKKIIECEVFTEIIIVFIKFHHVVYPYPELLQKSSYLFQNLFNIIVSLIPMSSK
jgi:hypothetical protein